MTPNEKKALIKFKEISQGNTVAIAGRLRTTIGYAGEVCKKLWEKGYLERILPGQFAVYKLTSLGEEQVADVVVAEKEPVAAESIQEEEKAQVEDVDQYECVSCGVAVKEKDIECPKCGTVFEETIEEEGSAEKAGVLDQPSASQDWETCGWKWK